MGRLFLYIGKAGMPRRALRVCQAGSIRYAIGPTRFITLLQITVYHSVVNVRTFLVSARKVPKEADLRGAELIAPAIKYALLRISRRALTMAGRILT